jgi:hypothetical protein
VEAGLSHRDYTAVMLKKSVSAFLYVDGRRLAVHGQHGNRHMLRHVDALRLIESGAAKLMAHQSTDILRSMVAESCEQGAAIEARSSRPPAG